MGEGVEAALRLTDIREDVGVGGEIVAGAAEVVGRLACEAAGDGVVGVEWLAVAGEPGDRGGGVVGLRGPAGRQVSKCGQDGAGGCVGGGEEVLADGGRGARGRRPRASPTRSRRRRRSASRATGAMERRKIGITLIANRVSGSSEVFSTGRTLSWRECVNRCQVRGIGRWSSGDGGTESADCADGAEGGRNPQRTQMGWVAGRRLPVMVRQTLSFAMQSAPDGGAADAGDELERANSARSPVQGARRGRCPCRAAEPLMIALAARSLGGGPVSREAPIKPIELPIPRTPTPPRPNQFLKFGIPTATTIRRR